ncbi:DUF7853 family protein [Halocatena marina]|uniref:DUF7853 family protein n=1 Tax=Halocatena marina TaxID=2934937 RepID=UPI002010C298|nr:hypothetical protein [Halocatena marina]
MSDKSYNPQITLSLSREQHWTLHHVLLDQIEHESMAEEPTRVDPPSIEVYQSFETLDTGKTVFTIAQLKAMQTILAEYHHSTMWWEIERSQLEELLYCISDRIEQHQTAPPAD